MIFWEQWYWKAMIFCWCKWILDGAGYRAKDKKQRYRWCNVSQRVWQNLIGSNLSGIFEPPKTHQKFMNIYPKTVFFQHFSVICMVFFLLVQPKWVSNLSVFFLPLKNGLLSNLSGVQPKCVTSVVEVSQHLFLDFQEGVVLMSSE